MGHSYSKHMILAGKTWRNIRVDGTVILRSDRFLDEDLRFIDNYLNIYKLLKNA